MASELRKITLGGRYTLVKRLATGGMAEIFLARQTGYAGFERHAVVKLLQERYRHEQRVVDMFLEEARIGAALHHPRIVHVYDVGEQESSPFIAMEFIDGEELSTLCRRGLEASRFLPVEHAVDLVRQAAEGMGYFHDCRDAEGQALGIVHRDISPSNLLITRDGNLKIIDFGIARAARSRVREDKAVPGKYHYMSPEQVRGERVDHRSDIFSLGVVLYEITVAKRLFKGRPEEVIHKITRERIKPPTFVRREFPPALESIVMRCLEAHADDRYQSARELAADLDDFLREGGYKSGPTRVARYLTQLEAADRAKKGELVVAGEAWIDDEGEDALDFGRTFQAVKDTPVPTRSTPRAMTTAAVVPPPPAPAPPPSSAFKSTEQIDDEWEEPDTLQPKQPVVPAENTPVPTVVHVRKSGPIPTPVAKVPSAPHPSPVPRPPTAAVPTVPFKRSAPPVVAPTRATGPAPAVKFGEGMIARPPGSGRWILLAVLVLVALGAAAYFAFLR